MRVASKYKNMKSKKEILAELTDEVRENLIRIEITTAYVTKKHAEDQKEHYLHELAKLEANKKENDEWLAFLEEEAKTA
jgi:RNase adaptor protein for sRNA GlmZ degradation